jgi:hypothetical protein
MPKKEIADQNISGAAAAVMRTEQGSVVATQSSGLREF